MYYREYVKITSVVNGMTIKKYQENGWANGKTFPGNDISIFVFYNH